MRAHPLVFGTVVFLASESMVFAALLAAYYYLRGMTVPWPPAGAELDAGSMAIGTLLLAAGSVTMTVAQVAATRGERRGARIMLIATIALAAAFLALEWHDWAQANFGVADSA